MTGSGRVTSQNSNPVTKCDTKKEKNVKEVDRTNQMIVTGSNFRGELGLGSQISGLTSPRKLGLRKHLLKGKIKFARTGYYHSICVVEDKECDRLIMFGENCNSQLGLGDYIPRMTPVLHPQKFDRIVLFECGHSFSFFVTSSGKIEDDDVLHVFGNNASGQLGLPKMVLDSSEIVPHPFFTRKRKKGRVGVKVKTVACGGNHTMILFDNGQLYGMGNNKFGQLGVNPKKKLEQVYRPILVNPKFQKKSIRIKNIVLGFFFSLFIADSGKKGEEEEMFSCGENTFGACGVINSKGRKQYVLSKVSFPSKPSNLKFNQIITGDDHVLVLMDDKKTLYCFGRGKYGALGLGENTTDQFFPRKLRCHKFRNKKIRSIAANGNFSMFLMEDFQVFVTGSNKNGQLGMNHRNYINSPQLLRFSDEDLGKVTSFSLGYSHSLFVCEEGEFDWENGKLIGNEDKAVQSLKNMLEWIISKQKKELLEKAIKKIKFAESNRFIRLNNVKENEEIREFALPRIDEREEEEVVEIVGTLKRVPKEQRESNVTKQILAHYSCEYQAAILYFYLTGSILPSFTLKQNDNLSALKKLSILWCLLVYLGFESMVVKESEDGMMNLSVLRILTENEINASRRNENEIDEKALFLESISFVKTILRKEFSSEIAVCLTTQLVARLVKRRQQKQLTFPFGKIRLPELEQYLASTNLSRFNANVKIVFKDQEFFIGMSILEENDLAKYFHDRKIVLDSLLEKFIDDVDVVKEYFTYLSTGTLTITTDNALGILILQDLVPSRDDGLEIVKTCRRILNRTLPVNEDSLKYLERFKSLKTTGKVVSDFCGKNWNTLISNSKGDKIRKILSYETFFKITQKWLQTDFSL